VQTKGSQDRDVVAEGYQRSSVDQNVLFANSDQGMPKTNQIELPRI
jgi:hypothetical protein